MVFKAVVFAFSLFLAVDRWGSQLIVDGKITGGDLLTVSSVYCGRICVVQSKYCVVRISTCTVRRIVLLQYSSTF